MSTETRSGERSWPAAWVWLYPATYAIHILEELWGGRGFSAWLAGVAGVELAAEKFLVWNALALLLMGASVPFTLRFRHLRWLPLAYGVAFALNALSHVAASLYTVTYSPGLASGLLLWLPLGAWTLLYLKPTLTRRGRRAGLAVGVSLHCAVLLLTLMGERLGL
jgi:hypothetical protein